MRVGEIFIQGVIKKITCDTLEIAINLEYHIKLCLIKDPFVTKGPEKAISGYFEELLWKNR